MPRTLIPLRPNLGGVTYANLRAAVEEYAEENVDHKAQTDTSMNNTIDLIDKFNQARISECSTLLKSLHRVSETLEANLALKATIQAIEETNTTTSGNITSLTEFLRNANLP
ncbi:hypothetical protein Tco_1177284 [Tanacetum coccineum]